MQDETDSPCRRRHTHGHTDACTTPLCVYQTPTHTRLYPSFSLAPSLSLSHTHKNTCVAKENDPVTLFVTFSSYFFFPQRAHPHWHTHLLTRAFHYFALCRVLGVLKPQKSEHINESNAGESGKQAREGGRAACLSACSMATIVHCTFSEPTRAEAISTDSLEG